MKTAKKLICYVFGNTVVRNFFIILLFSFALFIPKTHAATVLDTTSSEVGNDYCLNDDGNNLDCAVYRYYFDTGDGYPIVSTGKLESLTLKIDPLGYAVGPSGTPADFVGIKVQGTVSGQHVCLSNSTRYADLNDHNDQWSTVTFYCNPDDTINFATEKISVIYSSEYGTSLHIALTTSDLITPTNVPNGNFVATYCYIYAPGHPYCFGPGPITDRDFWMVINGLPAAKTPVLIIPGIMGSFQKNGEWVIDPVTHSYENLIETLIANGYEEGKDLFRFPYDWRQSNKVTALYLEDKIQQIKQICGCDKVDIVAHSMGGLVARQYIQSDRYKQVVDHLIFLGTPHLGSPKSYLAWEAGEAGPVVVIDSLYKFFVSREAKKEGCKNSYDYIRNYPILSVQELLPTFNYLKEYVTGNERIYPYFYPRNQFLEDLNNNIDKLYGSGVRITNIVGELSGDTTIRYYKVVDSDDPLLWEHGYPYDFNISIGDRGIIKGVGDKTVPIESATAVSAEKITLNSGHVDLQTDAEGIIYSKLTGNNPTVLVRKHQTEDYKFLLLKMLSPADMMIIAPDGRRIGRNFETGEEINEIEYAFYSGFKTDDEFVTIPNPLDGEYKIITKGTGDGGEYTVAVGYISNDQLIDKDFTAYTQPGMVTELKLSLNSNQPEGPLEIVPSDVTAPEIKITSPESKDYSRSELLPVNVKITDESGVKFSELKLDDTVVNQGQNIDLFFEKLGNHKFTVSAQDNVGNSTSTGVALRIVATPDSVISDVERAYSLGWISKKQFKDSLIRKLKASIRLEKRIIYIEEKSQDKPKVLKRIEKIEKKIDKILIKLFMLELELGYKSKIINKQAYDLLREDINWLINN